MLFKEMLVTKNLLRVMFRLNNTKLRQDKIKHKTDNTLIMHLASESYCSKASRMGSMSLTKSATCNKKCNLCSKVALERFRLSRTTISCILDEDNAHVH